LQKEIGDVRHQSAGVDIQQLERTQATHAQQLKQLRNDHDEQHALIAGSFAKMDWCSATIKELASAAADSEQRIELQKQQSYRTSTTAEQTKARLEMMEEQMQEFRELKELSEVIHEIKAEIPELKVARHELVSLQRTVAELQNSQVSMKALEALKNEVKEQGQTDKVMLEQAEELNVRMSSAEQRFQGFAQSLLAMHQVLGEHALDLQWLFYSGSLDEGFIRRASSKKLCQAPNQT